MIGRVLAVAVGLCAVCFSVSAQQANWEGTTLSLYQPKAFTANDSFLLLHNGPVHTWSDGGWLASENALASFGMVTLDLFPSAYLPSPNPFGAGPTNKGNTASDSRSHNFGTDPKDSPEMMVSPPDRIYYGGEIGFMYGQWSGKGSGDLMESYILGTAGNDHFQITAGAAYEESSGHTPRFHSFFVPR